LTENPYISMWAGFQNEEKFHGIFTDYVQKIRGNSRLRGVAPIAHPLPPWIRPWGGWSLCTGVKLGVNCFRRRWA